MSPQNSARTFFAYYSVFVPFNLLTKSDGFTVISAHAGLNPLFIAFPADLMFDHAQQ